MASEGNNINSANKSLFPIPQLPLPFHEHQGCHWCNCFSEIFFRKWWEAITSSSPPQDTAQKTGKLHPLMDASYYIHWVGNLHIGKGKWTEGRLNKTSINRSFHEKRERWLIAGRLRFCRMPNTLNYLWTYIYFYKFMNSIITFYIENRNSSI